MYCTHNLKERNADIEALIHIGMPHNPNIGDEEGSKITLKERKPTSVKEKELSDSYCKLINIIIIEISRLTFNLLDEDLLERTKIQVTM